MLSIGTKLEERYRIIREIGGGGCGYVYEAVDEVFGCSVAVKEIKEAVAGTDKLRRAFEREARLLHSLKHASLPRVSHYFIHDGAQFLVMDFVEGTDLAALLKDHLRQHHKPFSSEEVLPWADKVLDVLEYLHGQSRQIIHRDIKPANIKLTTGGGIYLLDFGLAKGKDMQASTDVEGQTTSSVHGFTHDYAPLEQLQCLGTTPQSDLYSLGATLYHLLTGQLPPSASQRDEAIQQGRGDPLQRAHEINPAIPEPISAIISQALEVRSWDRIKSASKMRAALRQAQQSDSPQWLIAFLQRHRRSWLPIGLVVLVLVSIVVLVRYNFLRSATSVGDNSINNQITGTPTPSPAISPAQNVRATPSTLKLKQELKGHTAVVWAVAFSPEGKLLASAGADGAIILWDTKTWEHKEPLRGHKGDVYSLSFSPDGQTLASAGKDKTIKLWNTRTGQLAPVQLPDEHKDEVWRVAFSPDGKLLASAGKDKTLRLWDVSNDWLSRPLIGHTDEVLALAFAPDGSTLASTGYDGRLLLWDVHGGAKPEELRKYARALYSVAFSPDGKYLVCAGEDGSIKRWRRQSQSEKWEEVEPLERHTNWVLSLAVSPDSKLLVSIGKDDKILLWDLQAGASKPLNEQVTGTRAIAFSSDGQTLVSGGEDTIVRVWQ